MTARAAHPRAPRARRLLTLALGSALVVAPLAASAVTTSTPSDPAGHVQDAGALADAADPLAGYEGECRGSHADLGVTVVVDFQNLGPEGDHTGETIVRCAPPQTPGEPFDGTGGDAIDAAGIDRQGVQQHGPAFTCRLDGRPTATERIVLDGNPNYRERCLVTPPARAFWSYWHADGESGVWTSSSVGVENRQAIPGGYEGWSFYNPQTPGFAPIKPRVQPLHGDVVRLPGSQRYETAANIAGQYQPGMDRLFLATGADYPDALAASAIAGMQGAPILLVRPGAPGKPDAIPSDTEWMLKTLYPREIVVLGGTNTIDGGVVSQVKKLVPTATVARVQGENRYDTALNLLERYGDDGATVSVANGTGFADALTASAIGAERGEPMILVQPTNVPRVLDGALEGGTIDGAHVYGGTGAVSEDVRRDLAERLGSSVGRTGGENRWETSEAVAARYGPGVEVVYVATGTSFPDALAGGAIAGRDGVPVVLTSRDNLTNPSRSALERLKPGRIVVLGGEGAVSEAVLTELEGFVTP